MTNIQDLVDQANDGTISGLGLVGLIAAVVGFVALFAVSWNLGFSNFVAAFGAPDVHIGFFQAFAVLFVGNVISRWFRRSA